MPESITPEPDPAAGPTEWITGVGPTVGVRPWADEHPDRTPDDPRLDPNLVAEGDRRNVVDEYRYFSREAIIADLDTRRHDFHVAIENWAHDANIGTVVRTANAFLAAECTSSGDAAGTGAGRWSPIAISISGIMRASTT